MGSRIARLVFGLLPARAGEFGDACVAEAPVTFPPAKRALLGHLRQKLLSDETLAEHLQSGNADALTAWSPPLIQHFCRAASSPSCLTRVTPGCALIPFQRP